MKTETGEAKSPQREQAEAYLTAAGQPETKVEYLLAAIAQLLLEEPPVVNVLARGEGWLPFQGHPAT